MTQTVATDDTVSIQVVFKDLSESLIDPDGSVASFKVYDEETGRLLSTGSMVRSSQGVYTYDWVVPSTETVYIVESYALFSTNPQLKRSKVKAKFRP